MSRLSCRGHYSRLDICGATQHVHISPAMQMERELQSLTSYLPQPLVDVYRSMGLTRDLYPWQVRVGGISRPPDLQSQLIVQTAFNKWCLRACVAAVVERWSLCSTVFFQQWEAASE